MSNPDRILPWLIKETEMAPIGKKEKDRDQMEGKKDEREMDGELLENRREEARQHVCNIFECVCVTG